MRGLTLGIGIGVMGCWLATPATAEIRLPGLFGSGMVLQRDTEVAVWGWANAGETVRIQPSWSDVAYSAEAADDGRWFTRVRTPGAGGPHSIVFEGENRIQLDDVLCGEVWVCSGQSNMEWSLGTVIDADPDGREAVLASARDDGLRLFHVPRKVSRTPVDDVGAHWRVAAGEDVLGFSAVGFYFGRALRREVNVPVGLIESAWGGTVCEAWTSAPTLLADEDFAEPVRQVLADAAGLRDVAAELAARQQEWWQALAGHAGGERADGWHAAEFDDSTWQLAELPGPWEQSRLGNFDGVVWYRRPVDVPAGWNGRDLQLSLGPIDDMDSVWFNGTKVGGIEVHGRWTEPRHYTVPANVIREGRNTVAVRVVDTGGGGGLVGNAEQVHLQPAGDEAERKSLAGPWRVKASAAIADLPAFPRAASFHQNSPTALFNGMIAPLVPFGIRGAIWYQGESNRTRGAQYRRLFPSMIQDWRKHFGRGEFPFYFVQIAPYAYDGDKGQAAELREAQTMTLALPNTGMAVTMDIGNPRDIHPKNKWDVGERLARWALADVHGHDVVKSGPLYEKMEVTGNAIRLHFRFAEGLRFGEEANCFAIAGADGVFVPATARIDGTTVVVQSDAVTEPVAVRYAWGAADEPSLQNGAGLPAPSFRTDLPSNEPASE